MNESEGIHDPDWERYKVTKDGVSAPVGDPTRWGAQIFVPLDDAVPELTSPQILQVSTRDAYSRSWTVLGTLTLPKVTWNTADLFVELLITLGVGQVQVTHAIVLMHPANVLPPAGLPSIGRGGLCLDQYLFFGGPYDAIREPDTAGNLSLESRAFAIVGGLIGQSVSVRAKYLVGSLPPTPGFPTVSRLALIVAPYAAGEGL